jgi:hypothetical protein
MKNFDEEGCAKNQNDHIRMNELSINNKMMNVPG